MFQILYVWYKKAMKMINTALESLDVLFFDGKILGTTVMFREIFTVVLTPPLFVSFFLVFQKDFSP